MMMHVTYVDALNAFLDARVPGLRLEDTPVPLVPELRLWLLGASLPSGRLSSDALGALLDAPPYWAFCWGSGAVMARYVVDHPEIVRGKTVLDVGSGSGVVAIAAARAGAKRVVACDLDAVALEAVQVNAHLNAVTLDAVTEFEEPVDVLTTADILYDQENLPLLQRFRERATTVLVADSRVADFRAPGYEQVWAAECRVTPDLEEAPSVNRVKIYAAQS